MNFNFKNYIPHTAAIIIFAVITLIYFKPLLNGKVLKQHDIAQHRGMSKEIADYREKHHTEPLWTNSMFGGMPAYQISTLYPGNWLSKLDAAFKLYLPHPGGYLFLYCLGFFILLLCLEVNVWLALIGGIAYGLSSYFLIIIQAGHNSKANALGYLPALLGGIILLFRGRHWLGLAVTALFTAMELNANHVQIAYYGYMLIAFVVIGYFINAIKEKKLPGFIKAFSFFIIACIIGALPNAGNLLTTNEYGKYSNRGKAELTITADGKSNQGNTTSSGLDKDYATAWSYGISETFSFLIPDFKGGGDKAIGMADQLWVMITAVVISMFVMMLASGPISAFVNRNPSIKVLALSFLVLIGVSLMGEGLEQHINKGYIYFAMAFSFIVEIVNLRIDKKSAKRPM